MNEPFDDNVADPRGNGQGAAPSTEPESGRVPPPLAGRPNREVPRGDPSRLAQLGRLASGLAHEIRNPLSTMKLNLQLLQEERRGLEDSPRERKTQRKLQTLTEEVNRLENILDDFLAFARGAELTLDLVDVGELMQQVADFVEPELTQRRILLRFGIIGGELPRIPADADKLKQALLNLVINARQAMEATGEGGELFLRAWCDGDEVMLEVTDTGPGIAAEELDRIFHVYYSTKRGGTGLGLPTVKRIVEEHGGRLLMHSEPGKGTQFILALPVRRDDAEGRRLEGKRDGGRSTMGDNGS